MADKTCDFCGAAVEWTPEQVALDAQLMLFTGCDGLGVTCDACDERQIELLIASAEREDAKHGA